ncbi:MAG: type II CRISPR-associated endonuclease Cas1 [Alphaproteobacteria bacterium CG_4_9_14_3_um_filter_47_13]|nr:MAG: type II CRISPR-associated endonuclease Cas1 [Alphaproteobacteria bacterium CG_4_9_14_3_um_filter_47_13]
MIQNAAALSLSKGQLKLQNDEGAFTLPIEDITALILESPQITLSSTLLSACQEHGVAVLTCDATHMPNGALLPFQPHSRQSRVAHLQISWTDALKNRLWQSVIQSKITNQATCLEQTTDEETAKRLYVIAQRVKSGDPDNIEAQAARYYWQRLLGDDFRRGGSDIINAALNYGYAVLRAFVARSQVAYGLLPTFGIHHCNQLNAYNLTDDLMEVFRPFTDYQVFSMRRDGLLEAGTDRLSKEARAALANIGNITCRIDGNTHTIANACDKMAAGLVNAIEGKSPALLLLPEFEIRNKTQ